MSTTAVSAEMITPLRAPRITACLHRMEDLGLSCAFGLMIVLPLLEIVLRKTLHTGIAGSSSLVQHLVLLLGMGGAAIAVRNRDLLPLASLNHVLPARFAPLARVLSSAVSVAITLFLAYSSYQFVASEREAGKALAYHLPVWVIESALPIGFLAIAARLSWGSSDDQAGRSATALLAGGLVAWAVGVNWTASPMIGLVLLGLAGLLGAPAFVMLGGAALLLFWKIGQPIASIPIAHYSLVTNATLPTLPLFLSLIHI